ncbi:MAG: sigma-70 family RNA polymerase sigma factor [Gemmatimonadales bacterium]
MERWQAHLDSGDERAAWDAFENRYRPLMHATIRRLIPDSDDVMDVYAETCAALTANAFERLRRYSGQAAARAAVSTWLVIVVRNITVDWLRSTEGRRQTPVPVGLSEFHRDIYLALCIGGHSPVEAFEVVRARSGMEMSFTAFLREIRLVRQTNPCPESLPVRRPEPLPLLPEIPVSVGDPGELADLAGRLATALEVHPPDVRLAVQLFVVDELSAAHVAKLVGWPNAKAVYNRVSRALESMRAALEREGVGRGDL